MNDSIYDIDFHKTVRWNLIRKKRMPRILALLYALTTPVVSLYQDFLNYRKAKLYDLMITGQVCYLESMLNDRYDFAQRRIRIVDGEEFAPVYLYRAEELHAVYLYRNAENKPVYLYTAGEGSDYANDFVVMVPKDISFSQIEMTGVIMRKRLPGMKFKIQTF